MVGKYETMYDDDSSFQVLFSSANFFLKYQNLFKTHKLYMWVQSDFLKFYWAPKVIFCCNMKINCNNKGHDDKPFTLSHCDN